MPTPKTILLAGKDRQVISELASSLHQLGLQVRIGHDARSTFQAILDKTPDLICLESKMPAGQGMSVLEVLAKDDDYCQVPVIVLTQNKDEDTIRRCGNLCAYYVNPSHSVWNRVEPVLYELLDVEPPKQEAKRSL